MPRGSIVTLPFYYSCGASKQNNLVDPEVIENLRGMLFILEGVSGLKVNLRKSSMAPVGNVQNLGALASLIGYLVVSLPISYLS